MVLRVVGVWCVDGWVQCLALVGSPGLVVQPLLLWLVSWSSRDALAEVFLLNPCCSRTSFTHIVCRHRVGREDKRHPRHMMLRTATRVFQGVLDP